MKYSQKCIFEFIRHARQIPQCGNYLRYCHRKMNCTRETKESAGLFIILCEGDHAGGYVSSLKKYNKAIFQELKFRT